MVGFAACDSRRQRWQRSEKAWDAFDLPLPIAAWEKTLRVVVYRKPVHHETKKELPARSV